MYSYYIYILTALIIILPFLFRTMRKKKRKKIIKISTISCAVLILFLSILNKCESDTQNENADIKIDSLITTNNNLNLIVSNSENKIDSLLLTNKELYGNIDILNSRLTPFIELAINQYPELSTDKALQIIHNKIKHIDKKIEKEIDDIKSANAEITVCFKSDSMLKIEYGLNKFFNQFNLFTLIHNKSQSSYFSSDQFSLIELNNSTSTFKASVTANVGALLYDHGKENLKTVKAMSINIPLVFTSDNGKSVQIQYVDIKKINVNLYINGALFKTINKTYNYPNRIMLSTKKDGAFWAHVIIRYPLL